MPAQSGDEAIDGYASGCVDDVRLAKRCLVRELQQIEHHKGDVLDQPPFLPSIMYHFPANALDRYGTLQRRIRLRRDLKDIYIPSSRPASTPG
jgi:hypothetical protein